MKPLVITNKGKELVAKLVEGTTTAKFTKLVSSSKDYSEIGIAELTQLENIEQETEVASIEKTDNYTVLVSFALENTEINTGYYIKTLGIYAEDDNGNIILFGVCISDEIGEYLPAFGGATPYVLEYRIYVKVDNAEQITIEVSSSAYATASQLANLQVVIDTHTDTKINSESGVHGIRHYNNNLGYYDDALKKWIDIETTDEEAVKQLIADNATNVNVVDSLDSVKTDEALSANQGNVLKKAISPIAELFEGATGIYTIALSTTAIANATGSTAIGSNALASGNQSTGLGYCANASGDYSTALGFNTKATQWCSTAIGGGANAGTNSIAIGSVANAIYYNAIAMGSGSVTSVSNAISIGANATTSGVNSITLGMFSIASGTSSIAVGRNSTVSGSNAIAIGYLAKSSGANTTVLGSGANASGVNSTALGYGAKSNGINSTALGSVANASGSYSTALGSSANAGDSYSTALGYGAKSNGINSTALGSVANASGSSSTALGSSANAGGSYSTAIGSVANAGGSYSTAIGRGANASGNQSTVLGSFANASGVNSTALGYGAKSSGVNSTALGSGANAGGDYSTALGYGAKSSGVNSTALGYGANVSYFTTNTIQLGDASYLSTLSCRVALTTTSDMRDKTDIENLQKSLEFLSKIQTATYVFNHRSDYVYDIDTTISEFKTKAIAQKITPMVVNADENTIDENYADGLEFDTETEIDTDLLSEDEKNELDELLSLQEKRKLYGLSDYDKEAHKKGTKKHSRKRVGVLGQQVRECMIETFGSDDYADILVDTMHNAKDIPDDVENVLGVNYQSFIPFLIDGVSRLWEMNKALEERVKELEEKINE